MATIPNSSTVSGNTRYRWNARAGPRTQSSRTSWSGRVQDCSSAIGCAQALMMFATRNPACFSRRTRTRLAIRSRCTTKSNASFASVTRSTRTNPAKTALRFASLIATTGRLPRVIWHHHPMRRSSRSARAGFSPDCHSRVALRRAPEELTAGTHPCHDWEQEVSREGIVRSCPCSGFSCFLLSTSYCLIPAACRNPAPGGAYAIDKDIPQRASADSARFLVSGRVAEFHLIVLYKSLSFKWENPGNRRYSRVCL